MAAKMDEATTLAGRDVPNAPAGRGRGIAALLRHPTQGWRDITATPMSTGALFAGVAAPLAAIGPVARAVHALVFGTASMGIIDYRPTVPGAILTALIGWAAALVAVWLLAVIINLAAPRFGGTRDHAAAAKVAIFGSTAWWLASGFALFPAIGFLQIIGLYSLLLFFIGAPIVMRADSDAGEGRGVFLGMTAMAAALALGIAALVVPDIVGRQSLRPTVETAHGREVVTGAPDIPGSRLVAPVGTRKAASAPGTIIAANGTVAPGSLQALLPERIGGFLRTSLESQSNLSAGAASADAKATYILETDSFTLTITDAGAPGALATNNSVIAGEVNRTTDSGYQRSQVINGVRIIEKWSNADHGGSYSRTIAGRFTVEAQGTAPNIDTLRAAVNAVDQQRLTALGH